MPSRAITQAVTRLRRGGIVAYPTESVYGLGCDPGNRTAVMRLLRIKRRTPVKGLILIAADVEQLRPWVAEIPAHVRATWPGAHTWLVRPRQGVAYWITGRHARIAVRVSAHASVRALCQAAGMALVSTSANRAGQVPARSYREVLRRFGADVDYVLPGHVGRRKQPTPIVDADSGQLIRPG